MLISIASYGASIIGSYVNGYDSWLRWMKYDDYIFDMEVIRVHDKNNEARK